MASSFNLNPNDRVYKYELRRCIGGGASGEVWLAKDHTISRNVAVKVLNASMAPVAKHLREAQIGNHLDHQNLVKVHYADVAQHNGTPIVIIAMDYHKQGSVLGSVCPGNFLPMPHLLHSMVDILRGLEYLHEQHFYHNDIKPQNILIGLNGEGILTDYGISCYSPDGQSVNHRGFYKLHVAPETLGTSQVNVQTDVYQACVTAFRLLNGLGTLQDKMNRLGEDAYNQLVKAGKAIENADYLPFVPQTLKRVINKATHVDPAKRYQSALEMRRALEKLSYPGYWTCSATGAFIGHNGGYEYSFDVQPKGPNQFELTTKRRREATGRETRVTGFCRKNVNQQDIDKALQELMLHVVTG